MARRRRLRVEDRVAARVRSLRETQGLSQAEFARLVGTSRSQVSEVEAGRKSPTLGTLDSFATALGVEVEQLLATGVTAENPQPDDADGVANSLRTRGPHYVAAAKALIKALDKAAAVAVSERERAK